MPMVKLSIHPTDSMYMEESVGYFGLEIMIITCADSSESAQSHHLYPH